MFIGTWKLGAILLSLSVLYGDDGIRHRIKDSGRDRSSPTPRMPSACLATSSTRWSCSTSACSPGSRTSFLDGRHLGRRSGPDLLHLRHHRPSRRASSTPTATSSPTRISLASDDVREGRAVRRDGVVGLGGGHLPADRPLALRRGPVRLPARGRLRPPQQLDALSRNRVENVFTTPTAMRSMMAIEDAGERYPQRFRDRLLGRRAAEPGGDPLVPRPVRPSRCSTTTGSAQSDPLCSATIRSWRSASSLHGQAGARLGRADPRRGREPGPASASAGEICLRARSNPHYPLGYWNNEEAARETFGGEWFHTRDAAERDDRRILLVRGARRRRDHRAGYRIGPFESSPCIEHPAVRRPPRSLRRTSAEGTSSRRSSSSRRGKEPTDRLWDEIKSFVRDALRLRLSAADRFTTSCRRPSPARSAGSSSRESASVEAGASPTKSLACSLMPAKEMVDACSAGRRGAQASAPTRSARRRSTASSRRWKQLSDEEIRARG